MTQEIKPTYVTFEQAEKLKEKRFDVKVNTFFDLLSGNQIDNAPLGNYNLTKQSISIPEQWQVIEWLRVNHEIEVCALRYTFSKGKFVGKKYMFVVEKYKKNFNPDLDEYHFEEEPLESSRELNYNSPQEAYSAAFDYILNNLI